MASEHVRLVAEAAQAVTIHSATTFSWFGEPSAHLGPAVRRILTPDDERAHLRSSLQNRLYTSFYCTGRATSLHLTHPSPAPVRDALPFADALSAANAGTCARMSASAASMRATSRVAPSS